MRSAYLWAATLGMPNTATYKRSRRPWSDQKHGREGVYRVKLLAPSVGAPYPFDRASECLASSLEIETYNLRVGEIVSGVTWTGSIDGQPIVNAVCNVSTWKQAGRSYWGRWGQTRTVECVSAERRWPIPNLSLNAPWAHEIVARVKMRMWNHSAGAVHVYVDSLITPNQLPVGDALGDWRLEETYSDGVVVAGPGRYAAIGAARYSSMIGVPKDSPRRLLTVADVA